MIYINGKQKQLKGRWNASDAERAAAREIHEPPHHKCGNMFKLGERAKLKIK